MTDIIPKHVAIIMDGNGRWAQNRFLPRIFGHKNGAEILRKIIKHAQHKCVEYLTFYAFSSENWRRPLEEVKFLMRLLEGYLQKEISYLKENNIRLKFTGRRDILDPAIIDLMVLAENETQNATGITVILAINYGSKNEILDSLVKTVRDCQGNCDLLTDDHIKAQFQKNLYHDNIPDPDLLIRTAGEKRLSNFLLWQLAYAELYFTDILWPDFSPNDFDMALKEYASRERKYGGLAK